MDQFSTQQLQFRSEDFRQYAYCPRIYFYRRFIPMKLVQTKKMELGRDTHIRTFLQAQEEKKGKQVAGLRTEKKNRKMFYNIVLVGRNFPAITQIDSLELVEEEPQEINVFELKTGKSWPTLAKHHKAQLLAQAMVAEEHFNIPVKYIGVYYYQSGELITEKITDQDRTWIYKLVDEFIALEEVPLLPECEKEKKCESCEYERYCFE